MNICPLCNNHDGTEYASTGGRDYMICPACELVWLRPDQRPDIAEELAEYQLHENDPADPGYRKHLSKLTGRMVPQLEPGSAGLDFGCGPGPAISVMLGEEGFTVSDFDPLFANHREMLEGTYDFITCTEVAEHFHDPAAAFALLRGLLKPGGLLGMMTRLRTPGIDFAGWYYIRERSHVVFYALRTMHWVAQHNGWTVAIYLPDVVIFRDDADQTG